MSAERLEGELQWADLQKSFDNAHPSSIKPRSYSFLDPLNDQGTPNNLDSLKQQLGDLLNCQICYSRLTEPRMCPHCSKLYCLECVTRHLSSKTTCANCRQSITLQGMTTCTRFVNELVDILNELMAIKASEGLCSYHGVNLGYYCKDCSKVLCCECVMFGDRGGNSKTASWDHSKHNITRIDQIYKRLKQDIQDSLQKMETGIKKRQTDIETIGRLLSVLRSAKTKQLNEIEIYSQKYQAQINEKLEESEQSMDITKYKDQLEQIEKLQTLLKQEQMDAEMTYCFAPDTSNREKYEAVMSQTVPTIKGGSEGTQNIIDQLVPKYHNFSFSFNNLMKCSPISKTVYSPIVSALGCEWRLKIYPDGNDDVRGKHLSIFVMMVNGQQGIFEYRIRIGGLNGVEKEQRCTIAPGESSGFNKFIKLEQVGQFVTQELGESKIIINYSIRYPLYYQEYRMQSKQLRELTEVTGIQQRQIQALQAKENQKAKEAENF